MSRFFRNIPAPPELPGVPDQEFFRKVKYNLEVLMGNHSDSAVMRSEVLVSTAPVPQLKKLKTGQQGIEILSASTVPASGNVTVPTLEDFQQFQDDMEALRADNEALREYVNTLTQQLRRAQ